jgi:alkyldihydroxyacetonephosphate synthase
MKLTGKLPGGAHSGVRVGSHGDAMASELFAGQRQKVDDEPAPSWVLRPDGWGYSDTEFDLTEKGQITLKGARYPFSGMVFPHFRPWIEKVLGINIEDRIAISPKTHQVDPIRNERFIAELNACSKNVSFADSDRLFHAHGHTCQEIYALRFGKLRRIPDAVVWPSGHSEVEAIVKLANLHNVVLIPFGGGTSVSGALECPADEQRMIVSVDMHRMNKILWVDRENLLVCMEAGIVGQDIKRRLEKLGLTIGHEPDSIEFSSLGEHCYQRPREVKLRCDHAYN